MNNVKTAALNAASGLVLFVALASMSVNQLMSSSHGGLSNSVGLSSTTAQVSDTAQCVDCPAVLWRGIPLPLASQVVRHPAAVKASPVQTIIWRGIPVQLGVTDSTAVTIGTPLWHGMPLNSAKVHG